MKEAVGPGRINPDNDHRQRVLDALCAFQLELFAHHPVNAVVVPVDKGDVIHGIHYSCTDGF